MAKATLTAKIGAGFYILWGVFHLFAANAVYRLAQSLSPDMTQGRLLQDAFYLLCAACAAILIAVTLNVRNDRQGYWINGVVVALADIPFILFVLMPGYTPWWPGLLGPLLWALAFLFTSFAQIGRAA